MTEPTILRPQTLAPQSEATALLHMIERVARDPSIDMNRLEPLLDRRDRVLASERQQAFDDAMAQAQQEMRSVATDSANPQTRSRYASYHAVDKVLRPIYTKHGFSLSFGTAEGAPDDHVRITCRVSRAGHREHYQIDMPCDGAGAKGAPVMTRTHAMGSASTYGRRYLLLMIFNVSIGEPNDDDGNAATKKLDSDQLEYIWETARNRYPNDADGELARAWVSRLAMAFFAETITDLPAARFDDIKLKIKAQADAEARKKQAKS
jgi:ERF superfamily